MSSGKISISSKDQSSKIEVKSTDDLIALAISLGAKSVGRWSQAEKLLIPTCDALDSTFITKVQQRIFHGEDPLGDLFCQILSPEQRRPMGATYTPNVIIQAMLDWSAVQLQPDHIIDPGTGSARFLVAAGRRFPQAELYGVESDPMAAILARGHVAAAGLADRTQIILSDYREVEIPKLTGRTLYIGNPPYVRHHLIGQKWKGWLVNTARKYGIEASQLAGLHAHFVLATAEMANVGDVGVLITSAEWLDVNYGRLIRELLLSVLGLKIINVIEPTAAPFPGTATTAVITGFKVGTRPRAIGLRRVSNLDDLGTLNTDRYMRRERLEAAHRWTPLTRTAIEKPEGFIELGELCKVHRGQVTGANRVWIAGPHSTHLPESVLYASVTKARELFAVERFLTDISALRRVIDLPIDLDQFDGKQRHHIEKFLGHAKSLGADCTYVASHRKAWWAVGLREPAPILATYMARRPPMFVRNLANARHINIAHGLYPRETLSEMVLTRLALYLSRNTRIEQGRTYAGGLTKFEPREMERLLVPHPMLLASEEWTARAI